MYRNIRLVLFSLLVILGGCGQTNPETDQQGKELKQEKAGLEVHFIDAGQADASLLHFEHNGESMTILIDAGDWDRDDVIHYLRSQNVTQIDIAIGTHPDADHIGQLEQVIRQFSVEEVWLSGNTSNSETFQAVVDAIAESNVDYVEPRSGDEFDIGNLGVEVLYPETITGDRNQESISLKVSYGEVDFIFTGDAEIENESYMVNSGMDLEAEILQLGHHGSSTSTSLTFLKAVSPEVAIYSAGKGNPYGHPHKEVVDRVRQMGAGLYGTDVHGTVKITTNGQDYQVETKRDGRIPLSGCVDINQASIEELQNIIHIGEERAQHLVQLRPYSSIGDLASISGLGPSRIADIKSQGIACVGG